MEKLGGLCVLLVALSGAVAGDKVTKADFTDGGELTFNVTPSYPVPITNILWKFNGDLLAEWVQDKIPLEFYDTFKGRAELNITNARLVVKKMSRADTGAYTVEINSKVHGESFDVRWFRKLAMLEVVIRPLTCGVVTESCNASCVEVLDRADIKELGPLTYSWKIGKKGWKVSEKDIEINTSDNVHDDTITCRISNPVSEQDSSPIDNPLYRNNIGNIVMGVLLPLLFLGVVGVGVGVLMWKQKICLFKNQNSPQTGSTNPPQGEVDVGLLNKKAKQEGTGRQDTEREGNGN